MIFLSEPKEFGYIERKRERMDILHDILGLPQLVIERAEVQETEIHL